MMRKVHGPLGSWLANFHPTAAFKIALAALVDKSGPIMCAVAAWRGSCPNLQPERGSLLTTRAASKSPAAPKRAIGASHRPLIHPGPGFSSNDCTAPICDLAPGFLLWAFRPKNNCSIVARFGIEELPNHTHFKPVKTDAQAVGPSFAPSWSHGVFGKGPRPCGGQSFFPEFPPRMVGWTWCLLLASPGTLLLVS
jgi:hypothetical protein